MAGERRTVTVAAAWAVVLLGASAAALGVLAVSSLRSGEARFSFLVFNLLLAWAPLVFALLLVVMERAGARWSLLAPGLAWLLFLPNAPYIWTDLIHLAGHGRAWFLTDFIVISSFAVAGLLAGYASLYLVHGVCERALGRAAGWGMVALVLPLASLGVYIGRVLRWHSWEAVRRFDDLLELTATRLADPFGNPALIAVCGLMTACMAAGYAVVWALTRVALSAGGAPRRARHAATRTGASPRLPQPLRSP